MLPNHRPLVVAEQFGVLEALFPGRIDMGLGRSVGFTDGYARRSAGTRTTPTISPANSTSCLDGSAALPPPGSMHGPRRA